VRCTTSRLGGIHVQHRRPAPDGAGLTRLGRSRTKWSEAFNFHLTSGRPDAAPRPRSDTADGGTRAMRRASRRRHPSRRGHVSRHAAPAPATGHCRPQYPVVSRGRSSRTGQRCGGCCIPAARVSSRPGSGLTNSRRRSGTGWTARHAATGLLDALALDDYVLATYRDADSTPVNSFAYYRAQDSTRAIHSPHDCIPGGGWQIQKLERRQFPAAGAEGSFPINRAVIQMGPNRQIVYYWFRSADGTSPTNMSPGGSCSGMP